MLQQLAPKIANPLTTPPNDEPLQLFLIRKVREWEALKALKLQNNLNDRPIPNNYPIDELVK